MTIVASVKVRDGVILGTDSMTQISAPSEQGYPEVLKTYSNARKLFQIRDRPIALAVYGVGNIGARSIEGLVLDFCRTEGADEGAAVSDVAQSLFDFIAPLYRETFEAIEGISEADIIAQGLVLGMYVAGYSTDDAPLPEEHEFCLPYDATPRAVFPAVDAFGANWRGMDQAFTRLYKGFDPRVRQRLSSAGMDDDDLAALLDDLEVPVIYDAMPVQDAIDFCCWILETTIGWASFHIGSATCGYPLQVATILADVGFTWVAKPELRLPIRG